MTSAGYDLLALLLDFQAFKGHISIFNAKGQVVICGNGAWMRQWKSTMFAYGPPGVAILR